MYIYPKGNYVYAYIRSKDSASGKKGTPYYIGKGKNKRVLAKHQIPVPKDRKYIVIISENLTSFGSVCLERRLIRWYGRLDLGNGILRNRTDGGEGAPGLKMSNAEKKKRSNAALKRWEREGGMPDETKERIREARKFQRFSDETRQKMSIASKGRKKSKEAIKKSADFHLGSKRSESSKEKMRASIAKRKPITCPHCKRDFMPGNYHHWHGDNCRHKLNDAASG